MRCPYVFEVLALEGIFLWLFFEVFFIGFLTFQCGLERDYLKVICLCWRYLRQYL